MAQVKVAKYSSVRENVLVEKINDFLSLEGLEPIQVPSQSIAASMDDVLKEYYVPRIVNFDPLASIGFPKAHGYFGGYTLSYKDGDYNRLPMPIEKYQEIIDTIRIWKNKIEQSCINYSGSSIEIVRTYLSNFYTAVIHIITSVNAVSFVDVELSEKPETKKLIAEANDLLKILEPYDIEHACRNYEAAVDRFGLIKFYKGKEDEIRKLTNTVDKGNRSPWLSWWAWDIVIPLFLKEALVSEDQCIVDSAVEYVGALLAEQPIPTPKDMKFVFSNILREFEVIKYNYSGEIIKISTDKHKFESKEMQEIYDQIYALKKASAGDLLSKFGDLAISGKLTTFFINNPKEINKKDINILNRFLIEMKLINI